MKVLSIDASTKSTGWAIFENNELKDYGCIKASSNDLIKRIQIMIRGLNEILKNNEINKIILEEVRGDNDVRRNIKTYKALMYLQAAIEFLVHDSFNNITIEYIYPSSWRKNCGIKTGRGIKRETLKQEDINFVKWKYEIDVNDDEADSICMGFSYTIDQEEEKKSTWGK